MTGSAGEVSDPAMMRLYEGLATDVLSILTAFWYLANKPWHDHRLSDLMIA
jgi:hypothetical protein